MTLTALLLVAIILAIALPALGVAIDGRIIAAALLLIAVLWLVGGSGLVAR